MDLLDFTVNDLLVNESFQQWILNPDEETNSLWTSRLQQHPEYAELFAEARTILLQVIDHVNEEVEQQSEEVWNNIAAAMDQPETEPAENLKKQLL